MAINVTEKIIINCSRSEVSEFMFNPLNDKKWISGVKKVANLTSDKLDIGSEMHREVHFLDKDIEYVLMVDALEPGKYLNMVSTKSPFPIKVNYRIEDPEESLGEEGVLVKLGIFADTKKYFMFVDHLMNMMVSQTIKGDLEKLKSVLEEEIYPRPEIKASTG